MSQQPFKKFINSKNNAAIKEKHKQEKKIAKKERASAIEKHFEEKRALRQKAFSANNSNVHDDNPGKRQMYPQPKKDQSVATSPNSKKNKATSEMPLNKFLAHCGVTSRRDAVSLIIDGKVTVNKKVITQPAFKVSEKDDVVFNGKKLFVTKNLVYILLNKPKDYITTTDDPQNRKTVLQLTKNATDQRIYPVGRLDRNTSGVLLLTNDGQLTQELTHPSFNVKKVYEAKLDKPLTKHDFEKILNGLKLEDGEIFADALAYADSKDKSVIGIELHSGRNRIVRRIFEHLGYEVKDLDRVMYANLTKKNIERGKWRYLSEKEIRLLKYMNKQKSIRTAGKEIQRLIRQNLINKMEVKGVSIIFENEDFIAVNKSAGMLTIPDRHDETQLSLYKILLQDYGKIFIVHRLDRDTSGLVLFAKNEESHKYLSQLFEKRNIEKIYFGIIIGSLPDKTGSVNEPIAEHPFQKGIMTINKKGKPSLTEYNVLEDYGIYSAVQFKIFSGRTHQIRVHMKFSGHPIACDPLYGDGKAILLSSFKKKFKLSKNDEEERPLLNRLALHSHQLNFKDAHGSMHALEAPFQKILKPYCSN